VTSLHLLVGKGGGRPDNAAANAHHHNTTRCAHSSPDRAFRRGGSLNSTPTRTTTHRRRASVATFSFLPTGRQTGTESQKQTKQTRLGGGNRQRGSRPSRLLLGDCWAVAVSALGGRVGSATAGGSSNVVVDHGPSSLVTTRAARRRRPPSALRFVGRRHLLGPRRRGCASGCGVELYVLHNLRGGGGGSGGGSGGCSWGGAHRRRRSRRLGSRRLGRRRDVAVPVRGDDDRGGQGCR